MPVENVRFPTIEDTTARSMRRIERFVRKKAELRALAVLSYCTSTDSGDERCAF
jgi:hypothetical protein